MGDQAPAKPKTPVKSDKHVEFVNPILNRNLPGTLSRQSTPFPKNKFLNLNVTPQNSILTSSSSNYTPDDRLAAGDLTSYIEAAINSSFTAGDCSFTANNAEVVKYDVAKLVDALQDRVVNQIQDLKLRLLNEIDQAYALFEADSIPNASPNAY